METIFVFNHFEMMVEKEEKLSENVSILLNNDNACYRMQFESVVMKFMKNGYYHVKHFEMMLNVCCCCCVWYLIGH